MQEIPVIDLSAARIGGLTSRQAAARQIDDICREIGFFTIAGHGVPVRILDELRSMAHVFFALPLEEKRRAIHPIPGTPRVIAYKDLRRSRMRMLARRHRTSRSSIISVGKAGQTNVTTRGPKAGTISFRIYGR